MGHLIAASAAVTAAGMVAYPLARAGSDVRRTLAEVVVGGLATTTTAIAVRRWGAGRTLAGAAAVGAGTLAVERLGTVTGVPFGRYRYSGRLRPCAAGVPLVVPAAWWSMALPAREVAHAVLGGRSTPWRRAVAGAGALTAWDLFLDPQMTAEGYWTWERGGRYRGIPLSNLAGWVATGTAVMAVLERLAPAGRAEPALVALYAGVAVMETIGFGVFFGDRLVAAVGGRRCCRWPRLPSTGCGMGEHADVVIVGAGVGGLSVAIRLAAGGRHVVVLERNDVTGGKLATVRRGGATFDVGPSLLTLPHVFDELLPVGRDDARR